MGNFISLKSKIAKDFKWFKDNIDRLDTQHSTTTGDGEMLVSDIKQINYDLFNNILNLDDLSYVTEPLGKQDREMPAKMVNKDIVSGKIKAVIGMEMKRPFDYYAFAVNPEAISRKASFESEKMKEFVINEITLPIKIQTEQKFASQLKNRELTEEEKIDIENKIKEETEILTPPEVRKYRERKHRDIAEIQANQLLEYLKQELDIKRKFEDCLKHLLIGGEEVMYVGILNDKPETWVINTIKFNCNLSENSPFIEDSDSVSCEYDFTMSDILAYFGDELSLKEIEELNELVDSNTTYDSNFNFSNRKSYTQNNNTIRAVHCVWKHIRRIGILTYYSVETDSEEKRLVDETYSINRELGDISISYKYIPEIYEGWKIANKFYKLMRPLPGQTKDINNLHKNKLPYYGVVCDNTNSVSVSLMDRMKHYQYYYNIIQYRIEMLIASDKGKKILMNMNAIPKSMGIDLEKWLYFFESSPYVFFNPKESGSEHNDVNTIAKVLDMSLVSQISQYIELAENIRLQCGRSVGITDNVEGQISPREAVRNTQQNLIQSSHILEPYYNLHTHFKRNVITALLDIAKIAYRGKDNIVLSYVLDDLSLQMFEVDSELLSNSSFGVFVGNSTKTEEILREIKNLAHAAMQNQKAELSDVLTILNQTSIAEAGETLRVAEKNRKEAEAAMSERQQAMIAEQEQKQRLFIKEKHELDKDLITHKAIEERKTQEIKAAILAASFNPDLDKNQNGINDFLEITKHGLDVDLRTKELDLKERGQISKENNDKKKLEIQERKLALENKKLNKN